MKRHRQNSGSRHWAETFYSRILFTQQNFDGPLSESIWNLNRRLGLAISRAAAGEGFTITPPYALPRMLSWWPKGPFFPPHKRVAARSSKCLPFPEITSRGALPIRTQRHIPDSIATLRLEIAAYLAAKLERCPCCAQPRSNRKNR